MLAQIPLINENRKDWLLAHFGTGPTTNQVWQEGMHPIELYTKRFTDQKMDYIHNNPVAVGIVEEPQHYIFSSARDYFEIARVLLILVTLSRDLNRWTSEQNMPGREVERAARDRRSASEDRVCFEGSRTASPDQRVLPNR